MLIFRSFLSLTLAFTRLRVYAFTLYDWRCCYKKMMSEIEKLEQLLAEANTRADNERERSEAAIDKERQRSDAAIEKERQRSEAAIEKGRQRSEAAIEEERQRSEAAIEEERQRSETAITTQTANTIRLIREHDLLSNRTAYEVGVPGKFVDCNPEHLRLYLIRLLKSLLSTRSIHERGGCRRD